MMLLVLMLLLLIVVEGWRWRVHAVLSIQHLMVCWCLKLKVPPLLLLLPLSVVYHLLLLSTSTCPSCCEPCSKGSRDWQGRGRGRGGGQVHAVCGG
jgi:hypothetical protein